MSILLGAIADDFTGATDLANNLVKQGMQTTQLIGVPDADTPVPDADAVIIALKSRTIPAAEAVTQSLAALAWLQSHGTQQFFFKYCSTFDSTAKGNIGPVADALLDALGSDFTVACPAFPTNARTVFKGHLFVGDVLLNQSGLQNHPLTPMTDANLVSVLSSQTPHKVGLVAEETVIQGPAAIRQAFDDLAQSGHRHAIVDAINDDDLMQIGVALADVKLITGGSGIAIGLPENFRKQGTLQEGTAPQWPNVKGSAAVLAGSCSIRTREQVAAWKTHSPALEIDPFAISKGDDVVGNALSWAADRITDGPVLIYSSADPADVTRVQEELGREDAGSMVEDTLGRIAQGLVEQGVRKMVVAGGETSGAVVSALEVKALRIGPEIDPGVPWTTAVGDKELALALKSGNFGDVDFFKRALDLLP
ncbi:MAG: four-carbon acid sugar kinase family protein [Alphaproteobacteria bacterium]|jgi:3-dehydrotetronate 4-kinase|nr:four-carbon acid sugar kinase family protein [Alphaproteobacteria bacterium]MBT4086688.1 four-carbon acid sugar kinase family protein [Alphaproteobacteria bacterium]MBT4546292.1 four-carbon acid sugar kinase family protein [Alphaproteobacteria bacterium]MBT5161166.1 four-carbon acid sugar kinase family protein [Alphaproteobacteria bacterium]MBT5919841.1 four-carbon acid sugar kinase family protein [Alphaproteobacteria bacterium]